MGRRRFWHESLGMKIWEGGGIWEGSTWNMGGGSSMKIWEAFPIHDTPCPMPHTETSLANLTQKVKKVSWMFFHWELHLLRIAMHGQRLARKDLSHNFIQIFPVFLCSPFLNLRKFPFVFWLTKKHSYRMMLLLDSTMAVFFCNSQIGHLQNLPLCWYALETVAVGAYKA